MRSIIIALLLNLLIDTSVLFTVKAPAGPVVAHVGSTVTLPCWISPAESAEALEIRWYRYKKFNIPVLLYQHGKIQGNQEESFRGRSSLTTHWDHSGGLKGGDVSLRLDNLTVKDGALFHCYVSGDKEYGSTELELKITALGSAPVLFPKPLDDGRLNVSCSSSGWYPQPDVTWMSDDRKALRPGGVSLSPGVDGLFSVQSWTTVSPSDAQLVSCSVSTTTGELKEGKVDIQGFTSSDPWKGPFFAVLICAPLIVVGLFFLYKYRDKLTGKKADELDAENRPVETDKDKADTDMEELRTHREKITIDGVNISPALKVTKDCTTVRDNTDYIHSEQLFSFELCAAGAQVFSSGRHYWEVDLAVSLNPPKLLWLIGVMKHERPCVEDSPALTPSNGFWFLCSDGPNGFSTNTVSPIKLSVSPRPERLGVLLDYDGGLLSFYSVKERKHLLTMSTAFPGPVVPLFNPGVGDASPLKILDITPEDEETPAKATDPLLMQTVGSV